jgi:hypothetical protein
MNALELLKKDHKEVKKLLEELEGEDAGREQRNIFNEIDQKLRLHEHLEETLLYPELKKHEESKEAAIEGFVEHHTANAVLLDLAKQKAGSPEFSARAKVQRTDRTPHRGRRRRALRSSRRSAWRRTP